MVLSFLIPYKRTLRPEGLHRSRGVAASGFRPLSNIPYCCHPQVYGPCFSSIVGDHPLRSPTRLRLGGLLPHQLADGPQAPPEVDRSFTYPFLMKISLCGFVIPFEMVFPSSGQVTNVLLTRSPLMYCYTRSTCMY